MKEKLHLPIPIRRALRKFGQDISDGRRRRRIPVALMAERADLSRETLRKIERGDPSVALGRYAAVLFVLGLTDRLNNLADATYDTVGRMLEEENLPRRIRLPSKESQK
jgi:transcriptional regulator with XRE-family HTH domain